jgi:hypothetical protein
MQAADEHSSHMTSTQNHPQQSKTLSHHPVTRSTDVLDIHHENQAPLTTTKMCQTKYSRSTTCKHEWYVTWLRVLPRLELTHTDLPLTTVVSCRLG